MLGLMQDKQLLILTLIEHAARYHAKTEIVSRTCEGPTVRTIYAQVRQRAVCIAKALQEMGVKQGYRVAPLSWSTHPC